jgi:hypothetical protein
MTVIFCIEGKEDMMLGGKRIAISHTESTAVTVCFLFYGCSKLMIIITEAIQQELHGAEFLRN